MDDTYGDYGIPESEMRENRLGAAASNVRIVLYSLFCYAAAPCSKMPKSRMMDRRLCLNEIPPIIYHRIPDQKALYSSHPFG